MKLTRAAAFLSMTLPALVARAEAANDALVQEAVSVCMTMEARMYECKEAFAEALVARRNPPPDKHKDLVQKALDKLNKESSAPKEARRQLCMGRVPPDLKKEGLERFKKNADACAAKEDCAARAACMVPLIDRGKPKRTEP
jgi:hypothetical protein